MSGTHPVMRMTTNGARSLIWALVGTQARGVPVEACFEAISNGHHSGLCRVVDGADLGRSAIKMVTGSLRLDVAMLP
jgi:hypothetical protein